VLELYSPGLIRGSSSRYGRTRLRASIEDVKRTVTAGGSRNRLFILVPPPGRGTRVGRVGLLAQRRFHLRRGVFVGVSWRGCTKEVH